MLYSLFSRHSIRQQAHAMGMDEILKYLMQNSDERFMKQIVYIIDQLNKEEDDDAVSDQNEEDTDFDDIDEEEQVILPTFITWRWMTKKIKKKTPLSLDSNSKETISSTTNSN